MSPADPRLATLGNQLVTVMSNALPLYLLRLGACRQSARFLMLGLALWLFSQPFSVIHAQEASTAAGQAGLRIGTAAVDITPRLGTPMAGYYSPRGADGIHDPLLAKAMVIDDGQKKVALVSVDLIKTTFQVVAEARKLIAQQTGIPAEAVMISATHSHTGPIIVDTSEREDDFGGKSPEAIEYVAKLPGWIADAVRLADEGLQPMKASIGTGHCSGVAFNRRFHMRDGSVGWNPGKLNPRIIAPAGPVDEDVPTVLFTRPDDTRSAAIISYSIHLDTVGGTEFSADMPGHLSRMLADAIDPDFFTLYFTACCGDVNHIDVSRGGRQKGHVEAARIGTILAASTLKAFEQAQSTVSSDMSIQYLSRRVQLPSYEVPADEVAAARELLENQRLADKPKADFRKLVAAYRAIDVAKQPGKTWEVEVQAITLGDQVAIVSLPGEIFVELGMTIRQGSPFGVTAIAELANGSIGYIPNRVAYPQGEYEVISARVAQGSGEILVDTALEMLRELFRESRKLSE